MRVFIQNKDLPEVLLGLVQVVATYSYSSPNYVLHSQV